ncbi:hypothetical protein HaLaN_00349 [Haematococcus lacustris]|uniref:Uncharacterized protein n=1 Tax=Haematococcus lacustris TaxID=44745 RepID=A0A699Y946_HAELA|nr:hypothetical protein HaLaN_00349 [Haematococcus lacustris]
MGRSGGAVGGGLRPADTEGGGAYGGHGEDLGSVGDDERGGDEAGCGRAKAGKSAAVDAFFSGASGGGGKGQGQQGQVQAHSHSQGLRLYKGRSGGKFG